MRPVLDSKRATTRVSGSADKPVLMKLVRYSTATSRLGRTNCSSCANAGPATANEAASKVIRPIMMFLLALAICSRPPAITGNTHAIPTMEIKMADPGRIGIDVGEKLPLEDAVVWAVENGVRLIDVQLDGGDNAFTRIDTVRAGRIRDRCEREGIRL